MASANVTPVGRVSYPTVFKPREFNGKTSYSVTLIFKVDDPDFVKFKKHIQAFAKREAGDKLKHPKWQWPWKSSENRVNADGERVGGYEDGTEYISFRRNEDFGPIGIVGPNKAPAKAEHVYGGCYGRAAFRAFCYKDYGNGPGVSLGLEAFQVTAPGEPFGSAKVDPDEVFDAVDADDADDEDIPF